MEDDICEFPLHKAVFEDDLKKLSQLLRINDVTLKDKHGNTPLHLAVKLGRKECVQLLLAHGAPVKVKNNEGWNPLAESISYGDRQTITSLLRKLKAQSREALEDRRPSLIKALKELGDFHLELKWDFHSWVPLVSRILPSDVCKIHKKGSSIRLDTTLIDFNDMKWERGDITFIFNGEAKPVNSLTVLDNKLKVFQRIRNEESESEIEDEVDILMSSDIVAAQMPTKNITFTRAQKGFVFREDKSELVGSFQADFYAIHGMVLDTKKRREHLSDEDLQKNKALMESLSRGTIVDNSEITRRKSLSPPPRCTLSWSDYSAESEQPPAPLGRKPMYKSSTKFFKGTVAMPSFLNPQSEEFPMTVEVLMDVLEVIAPFKHFGKLREFMLTRLPPGFPVKIEVPVFPTVSAKITFHSFAYSKSIPSSLFKVPRDYTEDPNRFPDL